MPIEIKNNEISFNHVLHTDGSGHWSDQAKPVTVLHLRIEPYGWNTMGELSVFFDTDTWDNYDDGLIYTDEKFLAELQAELNKMGLAGSDVDYSEQGMQGSNRVSLDAGPDFLQSWKEIFG